MIILTLFMHYLIGLHVYRSTELYDFFGCCYIFCKIYLLEGSVGKWDWEVCLKKSGNADMLPKLSGNGNLSGWLQKESYMSRKMLAKIKSW